MFTENAEPETFWQWVQWQIAVPKGSELHHNAPHRTGNRRRFSALLVSTNWTVNNYVAAVVGSIVRLTSEILLAGKPLMSACLRMSAASFAR